ncbi:MULTISPECIES: ThiF family adenylyltransferase [Mycobacteriaceae]|uniref:UBA/THIF-type NAD/FAD binding fold n=7 Tax=Mycobacteriaceae TaxID=1762 RepID=B1MPC3_MYCA9|nr:MULTISPECIES: ThiF family adenylyltransferase [Mycobacteriaceae]EUA60626.1 prokaryotic E2 A family protein [Mycobacteroides abscessus 1948]AMU45615.1 thiamine biosynthesis protein ThiF [Mycobacteroides abscessus]EIU47818.1 UBA/THIF-type NAD/FAD binding protein [Mycobacteroides abscessus 6G-0125-R]EIU49515.1 UBA/THIF-type NAD/FAD binding protein [Mycobacteroides abscessus 6G-0125-S]EIU54850.1 UBA/THIF-type NAD/FAD binding protein [Mycobacteroides abscessus 6G-0728-S]
MTRRHQPTLTGWQKHLLAELKALAQQRPNEIQVRGRPTLDASGEASLRISLRTAAIPHHPGGLQLQETEEFILQLRPSSYSLPAIDVDHTRFLGYPHVLAGQRLCIYLDPSREWQPTLGVAGLLTRLWDWLVDAAAGNFHAATAMYHAVGGVPHQAHDTPTIVTREPGPAKRHQTAHLIARSTHRYDLTYSPGAAGHRVPVITLATALPFGAASTFALLLALLDDPYLDRLEGRAPRIAPQSPAFLTALLASALRNHHDAEQYFVLAVPHPAGGPPHLLGGRLPTPTANALREVAQQRGVGIVLDPAKINTEIPIEWCRMSDERPEVTTRRDDGRPVNGFQGKTVHIWGCGGLGSWIAEFIARAGASEITVCDPGIVTGGLLVRQNYVEDDIGRSKAEALAGRLRAIRDDLTVTVAEGHLPEDHTSCLAADLIIDATVNNGITSCLDALATAPTRKALIAQVATDARSGTLGLAVLCAASATATVSSIDQDAGRTIQGDSGLELYHTLWQEPSDDELIPTRGCSVPTFHGSAADLVAVAATLVNLIGSHLQQPDSAVSGTHLIALPHAASGPRHHFLPGVTHPMDHTAGTE